MATPRNQRPLALLALLLLAGLGLWSTRRAPAPPAGVTNAPRISPPPIPANPTPAADPNAALLAAAQQQRSHAQLFAVGRVTRLLADDNEGSRHQKFLLRATPELTVLVVYNLDLAPRVPVAVGDSVTVRGEYIWNEKGGLIHWTHKDPAGKHQPGWVDLNGRRFQ
jgi:hypothetical protein